MIRLKRMLHLRDAARHFVKEEELVGELFRSLPELESFSFIKVSEYDDNNYYDNSSVLSVNSCAAEENGFRLPGQSFPSSSCLEHIEQVVQVISKNFGYDDEVLVTRTGMYSPWIDGTMVSDPRPDLIYFSSMLSGSRLPDYFFFDNDPIYALYHAEDHGRFAPETEFRIFARPDCVYFAHMYAKYIIKGRLPSQIENFYILRDEPSEREELKKYLEFVNETKNAKTVGVLSEVCQSRHS